MCDNTKPLTHVVSDVGKMSFKNSSLVKSIEKSRKILVFSKLDHIAARSCRSGFLRPRRQEGWEGLLANHSAVKWSRPCGSCVSPGKEAGRRVHSCKGENLVPLKSFSTHTAQESQSS